MAGVAAVKNSTRKTVRVKKSVLENIKEPCEVIHIDSYIAHGSGKSEPKTSKQTKREEPQGIYDAEFYERPWRCIWCQSPRPEHGTCPNCGKYGLTKFTAREKSVVFVEDV